MRYDNENSYSLGRVVKQGNVSAQFIKSLIAEDFAFSVTPETLGSSAALINAGSYTRVVKCELVDGAGENVRGFDGTFPIAIASVTAGDGDATIVGSTVTMSEGVGTVTITYTGTYASGDTVTLTLGSSSSLAGVSISNVTSVDTVIA